MRRCKVDDFFPFVKRQQKAMNQVINQFDCVDQSKIEIYGGYTSAQKAQWVDIELRKCIGHEECKSDEEIKNFFGSKQLILVFNEIRFDQKKFGEEAIIMESQAYPIWLGQWK